MNSYTLVIPVVYSDKKKYDRFKAYAFAKLDKLGFGKIKKWELFSNNVLERLQAVKFRGNFVWKKVHFSDMKDDALNTEDYIDSKIAFGGMEDDEKGYFYKEMFDTLYDKRGTSSCLFMLTKEKSIVEFSEKDILLRDVKNKITRSVRKAYYYLTNADIGLLIVEVKSANERLPENSYSNFTINNQSLVDYFLGVGKTDDEEKLFGLPYNDKCFIAEYVIRDNVTGEEKNVEPSVIVSSFTIHGEGAEEGLNIFFSQYFQIFWLCILQKTEILHVSQMVGRISRNKNKSRMRDEIQRLNEEYTLFCNQYDLIECTYDEDGERVYSLLRDKLNINRNKKEVAGQVDSFKKYAELISGKWNTFWLAAVSVICSFISIIKFLLEDGKTIGEIISDHLVVFIIIGVGLFLIAGILLYTGYLRHGKED